MLYRIDGPDSRWPQVLAIAAVTALVMAMIELFGPALRPLFLLDTGAVQDGELWRLLTAHVVNLGPVHTGLNILGLGLILCTLWAVLTPVGLAVAMAASAAAISIGWIVVMPPGVTYVGFSGITHGVLAFGALTMLHTGPRWFGAVVLLGVVLKLTWEGVFGAVPGADLAIGGRVSFVAHALAVLGGVAVACSVPPLLRLGLVAVLVWLTLYHAGLETAALALPEPLGHD